MTRLSPLLFLLLPGCVSVSYMQRQVQEVEDRLTECQQNWQNEMRAHDALLQDIREGKVKEPGYRIQWK